VEQNRTQAQRLKRVELSLLQAFVSVCDRLQLRYFLLGGTLLGAVRHKGFIPWDDDIDIGMPRQDFERFLSRAQAYLPEEYFLQTHKTDPMFPFCHAKLRDSRTTFIEKSVAHLDMHHGVYIDIFPLDFCPEGKLSRLAFMLKRQLLFLRVRPVFAIPACQRRCAVLELGAKAAAALLSLKYKSYGEALEALEDLYRKTPSSRFVANFCGAYGRREIVPADCFKEAVCLPFEGMQLAAPKEYDRYLRHIYGEYLTLPPEEKRLPHRVDVIDLDRPYQQHLGTIQGMDAYGKGFYLDRNRGGRR